MWSNSILYIPQHIVFLPSIYPSFSKIVMLLDIQCLQCYVCKIYEGNFIDQNRHEMKTLFIQKEKGSHSSVEWVVVNYNERTYEDDENPERKCSGLLG